MKLHDILLCLAWFLVEGAFTQYSNSSNVISDTSLSGSATTPNNPPIDSSTLNLPKTVTQATTVYSSMTQTNSSSNSSISITVAAGLDDCTTQRGTDYGNTTIWMHDFDTISYGTVTYSGGGNYTLPCSVYHSWYPSNYLPRVTGACQNVYVRADSVTYTTTSSFNFISPTGADMPKSATTLAPCSVDPVYSMFTSWTARTHDEHASLMRGPECVSYASILSRNRSELGHAVPNDVVVTNMHIGGRQDTYTCCGSCQVMARTVKAFFWSTAPSSTNCLPTTSLLVGDALYSEYVTKIGNGNTTILQTSLTQQSIASNRPELTNGSISIAVVDGYTFTYPTVYMAFAGTIGVEDDCGPVGKKYSDITVAVGLNHLSTLSWSDWPINLHGVVTNSYDYGACHTWGLTDPIATSYQHDNGSWWTTYSQSLGPPYNPIISPPIELLHWDPDWKEQCHAWMNADRVTVQLGIFDPPHILTPMAVMAEASITQVASSTASQLPASMAQPGITAIAPPAVTASGQPGKDPSNKDPAQDTGIGAGSASKMSLASNSPAVETHPVSTPIANVETSAAGGADTTKPVTKPSPSKSLDSGGPQVGPATEPVLSVTMPFRSGSLNKPPLSSSNIVAFRNSFVASLLPMTSSAIIGEPTKPSMGAFGSVDPNLERLTAAAASLSTAGLGGTTSRVGQIPSKNSVPGNAVIATASSSYIIDPMSEASLPDQTISSGTVVTIESTRVSPYPADPFAIGEISTVLLSSQITIPPKVITYDGRSHTADAASHFIIGDETLAPGSAITALGTIISLDPVASFVIIGSSTTALATEIPSTAYFLSANGRTYTADSVSKFIIKGQTLAPGSAITASGTVISLDPGASFAVIGSSVVAVATRVPDTAQVLSANGVTYTADPASMFVIDGQTLAPGSAIKTLGTVISLDPGASFAIIGSSTVAIASGTSRTPHVLSINGLSYTADPASNFIVGDQTLSPGSAITASGTIISLDPGGSFAVTGTSTIPIATKTTVTKDVFTYGNQVYTPNAESRIVIEGQTLAPGSVITVSGTQLSMDAAATDVVVGTSTQGIGNVILGGFDGASGNPTGTVTPLSGSRRSVSSRGLVLLTFWILLITVVGLSILV